MKTTTAAALVFKPTREILWIDYTVNPKSDFADPICANIVVGYGSAPAIFRTRSNAQTALNFALGRQWFNGWTTHLAADQIEIVEAEIKAL